MKTVSVRATAIAIGLIFRSSQGAVKTVHDSLAQAIKPLGPSRQIQHVPPDSMFSRSTRYRLSVLSPQTQHNYFYLYR